MEKMVDFMHQNVLPAASPQVRPGAAEGLWLACLANMESCANPSQVLQGPVLLVHGSVQTVNRCHLMCRGLGHCMSA